MLAFAIWSIAGGAASPFVGRIVDRFGPGKVIATGAAASGLSLVCLSFVGSLWQFYAAYTIAGFANAAMGAVPSSTAISNWFIQRRGVAIGIMSAGIGVAGVVFSPILGGWFIPTFGWRLGYTAIAALVVVVAIPLSLIVMKTRPSDMGLAPYGGESIPSPTTGKRPALGGIGLKPAIAGISFWLLALSFFLGSAGQSGLVQNQVPFLEGIGVPVAVAAAALGSIGLFSALAKLFFGWLCDRIHPRFVWAITLVLQAGAAFAFTRITPATDMWAIWLVVSLLGFAMGGWLPSLSLTVSAVYGMASYGAILGTITLVFFAGQALGPWLAGLVFDATGSYQPAFMGFIGGYAVALIAVLLLRPGRRR
jgi:MFS family permease